MDRQTFAQLLREQRAGIAQVFETVVYSVILGVTANQIYDSLLGSQKFEASFWWAVGISGAFLLPIVWRIARALKRKLPVRTVSFRALLLFDQKAEHREPVQMSGYALSTWANNDWIDVFSKNQQIRHTYLDADTEATHPFLRYSQTPQRQIRVQYLEYLILREFCGQVEAPDHTGKSKQSWITNKIRFLATRFPQAHQGIERLLLKSTSWQARHQQRRNREEITRLVGDYPITSLPDSLRDNMWIQARHSEQQVYEKQLLAGGQLMSWGFLPFTLVFPFKTCIYHHMTDKGRQTSLNTKCGELILVVRETRWHSAGLLGDTYRHAPHLFPYQHPYAEAAFEVTLSFAVSQFQALKPWLSDEFDQYFTWAHERMRGIEDRCSWDGYNTSVTRDEIRNLERILRGHDKEVQIDIFDNFPDTVAGDAERYLRWTRSYVWQRRRDGLEGLIKLASDVSRILVQGVVLRLLRMSKTQYQDAVTPWKTIEALGVYGRWAQSSLALRVHDRLWEIASDRQEEAERSSLDWLALGKSIALVQSALPEEDQLWNVHRVIDQFLGHSMPRADEIAQELWSSMSPKVRQHVRNSIQTMVQAEPLAERRRGTEYACALARQLPPEFRKEVVAELVARRPRDVDLRVGIQRLIRTANAELDTDGLERDIRYVLRESSSAHQEVRHAATCTLRLRSATFGQSGARTKNAVLRRLIALARDPSDAIVTQAVHALVDYASCVPPRYHSDVASVFLDRLPPRRLFDDTDPLVMDCSMGLMHLMEQVSDEQLKRQCQEALSLLPYRQVWRSHSAETVRLSA